MKRVALVLFILITIPSFTTAKTPENTIGRILIQTEQNGEAWYVDPVSEERFYMKNGDAAYQGLRAFGLGISNADLATIPIGLEDRFSETDGDGDGLGDKLEEGLGTNPNQADSDNDGYSDKTEIQHGYNPNGTGKMPYDPAIVNNLRGRIVLQVEERGQAWYIHPETGKRYYMSNGEAAYQIMRYLSLGITNNDIEDINRYSKEINCGQSIDCMISMIEGDIPATLSYSFTLPWFGINIISSGKYTHTPATSSTRHTYRTEILNVYTTYTEEAIEKLREEGFTEEEIAAAQQETNKNAQESIGTITECTYEPQYLKNVAGTFEKLKMGSFSTKDFDFADCTVSQ